MKSPSRFADRKTNSRATIARASRSFAMVRLMVISVNLETGTGSVVRRRRSRRVRQLLIDEVGADRQVEQFAGHVRRLSTVAAQCDHLLDQIPGLAGAQR